MKIWVTEIRAIDPITNELKLWAGPNVPGINLSDAEDYCRLNGFGFCKVIGQLAGEVQTDANYNPQWDGYVDYAAMELN